MSTPPPRFGRRDTRTGPIAWMARHAVAPNLLMVFLILGGLVMASRITQEIFPSYEIDTVNVSVALPGATPEEVERSVVLAIEEALTDIPGIDKLASTATEGSATVAAELEIDRDRQLAYDDIQQAIERIDTLPADAERPRVALAERDRRVVEVQVYGPLQPYALRMAAEAVRERLLLSDDISRVAFADARDLEILIEVPEARLRALGLTLEDIAATVRRSALDRPGGTVETRGGDILVRLADRRDVPREFAALPVIADARGALVRLGEIATIRRGFEDTGQEVTFNGQPSLQLDIFRVGAETPISVARAVRAALPEAMAELPEAVTAQVTEDSSRVYEGRMNLLLQNGFIGLVLVLVLLSLFLQFKLAFWVAVGIPTAFLGTFLFLVPAGASLNMVTMFAFILALGIVVDDAIVAGENIYAHLQKGYSRIDAAILGARDIATPLAFSILTNVVAFLPLLLMPGGLGRFFFWIPLVVAAAFLLSWIEALFILPAQLAHVRARGARPPNRLERLQRAVAGGLDWAIAHLYAPLLRVALSWRYATVAAMLAVAMVVVAIPASGRMGFGFFPPVPLDYVSASVTLPIGAPLETARTARARMVEAAEAVVAENGADTLSTGIRAEIDGARVRLQIYLQPPGTRPLSPGQVRRLWREAVGEIPEARAQRYSSSFGGPGSQTSLEVDLSHSDAAVLAAAATALARELGAFAQVVDTDTGYTPGKEQLALSLTEAGRALGLTAEDVGAQVRAAFFGVEALAQQEGRNEVTVRVRLPESERRSEADIERLLIATPDGGEVPLYQIATVAKSRSEASIQREDRRRVLSVTANVEPDSASTTIAKALERDVMPRLAADYPGLGYRLGGRQEAMGEIFQSFLQTSIPLTLIMMYALLAIPFRSFVQPIIVLMAIPFGYVGAVLGHMVMGMSLSMISIFGVIALAGVVINAAIVMIDVANRQRAAGEDAFEAIAEAGTRRFRPILLTTLTTFGGLAPMIFETSAQAKFLVPMAVSLGFGIVFATAITLLLIPALYLIVEDIAALFTPRRETVAGE
ncbi:MAG: efflux RND transporter permease subunit [Pseudomonadota bacterium]